MFTILAYKTCPIAWFYPFSRRFSDARSQVLRPPFCYLYIYCLSKSVVGQYFSLRHLSQFNPYLTTNGKNNYAHQTIKPIVLPRYLIEIVVLSHRDYFAISMS